jgi:hypothetical protein
MRSGVKLQKRIFLALRKDWWKGLLPIWDCSRAYYEKNIGYLDQLGGIDIAPRAAYNLALPAKRP